MSAEAAGNVFGGAIPVFRVENLRVAMDYYIAVLGFHYNWGNEGFASVSRDRCNLFLCEGDQGHPGTWAWVGVEDAAALEAEYRTKGARIRHPATNYPWAYEMQIEDLDGNVLRFGSDSIRGQPFGEFLDMNGRLWPPSPSAETL
jgi:hypothetical protein